MCGMPTFSTASVPSARTTAATYEQLASSSSNGASSVSDHLCSKFRSTSGRRASHAARCGVLWQLAASPPGILSAMPFIVAASPAASTTSRRCGAPVARCERTIRNLRGKRSKFPVCRPLVREMPGQTSASPAVVLFLNFSVFVFLLLTEGSECNVALGYRGYKYEQTFQYGAGHIGHVA